MRRTRGRVICYCYYYRPSRELRPSVTKCPVRLRAVKEIRSFRSLGGLSAMSAEYVRRNLICRVGGRKKEKRKMLRNGTASSAYVIGRSLNAILRFRYPDIWTVRAFFQFLIKKKKKIQGIWSIIESLAGGEICTMYSDKATFVKCGVLTRPGIFRLSSNDISRGHFLRESAILSRG